MKEKVKMFLKENKELIIGVSCIVISGATIAITLNAAKKKISIDQFTMYDKNGVIKFLQEMTNPNVKYAIFKETAEDAFQIVQL